MAQRQPCVPAYQYSHYQALPRPDPLPATPANRTSTDRLRAQCPCQPHISAPEPSRFRFLASRITGSSDDSVQLRGKPSGRVKVSFGAGVIQATLEHD